MFSPITFNLERLDKALSSNQAFSLPALALLTKISSLTALKSKPATFRKHEYPQTDITSDH